MPAAAPGGRIRTDCALMAVMATVGERSLGRDTWALADAQDGVVSHEQLVAIGYTEAAIRQRLDRLRLHPVFRGVYAVGRRDLSDRGRWRAALFACGPGAALSHTTAAACLGFGGDDPGPIQVSVPKFA